MQQYIPFHVSFNNISVISQLGGRKYSISEIEVARPGLEPQQEKSLTTAQPPHPFKLRRPYILSTHIQFESLQIQ